MTPGRRFPLSLLLVLLMALALRLAYRIDVSNTFLSETEVWTETDMSFFREWAAVISSGDFLTDRPLHPYHAWHSLVGTPQEWEVWYGGKTFHQAPLYPYLLALVGGISGQGREGMIVFQILLGLLTVLGVHELTRRAFGQREAVLAALLFGLAASPLFHETLLLRPALLSFLHVMVALLATSALSTGRGLFSLATGGGVALLVLTRPNGWLLLPLLLGAQLALRFREPGRGLRAVLILLGCAIVLLPLVARNLVVGVKPLATSSVGAVTFAMGSAEDVPGTRLQLSRHTRRILEESGGQLLPAMVATLRTHGDHPIGLFTQMAAKLYAFVHAFESPDNGSLELARTQSVVLSRTTLPTSILMALGLVGALLLLPGIRLRGREGGDLRGESRAAVVVCLLSLLVLVATSVLFYPSARFRVPALPFLCVLGAAVPVRLGGAFLGGHRFRAVSLFSLVLIVLAALHLPASFARPWLRRDDLHGAMAYYEAKGDPGRGLTMLLSLEKRVDAADRLPVLVTLVEKSFEYGDAALALRAAEDLLVQDPRSPIAHLALARLADGEGNAEGALRWAQEGVVRAPDHAGLHAFLSRLYARRGDAEKSAAHAARARQLEGSPRSRAEPATPR